MLRRQFSVFDKRAGILSYPPLTAQSFAHAQRIIHQAATPETAWRKYPSDFKLVEVSPFDDKSPSAIPTDFSDAPLEQIEMTQLLETFDHMEGK